MAKKGLWIALAVVAVIAISLYGFFKGTYNDFVTLDEKVKSSWAQVENQLQRRYDLIPNLVETVKGYAKQEKDVFIEVTNARSKVGGAGTIPDKISANNELSSALSRLLVVVENYPELKSNHNFLKLQDELAGTENRIASERRRYNEAVQGLQCQDPELPGQPPGGIVRLQPGDLLRGPGSGKDGTASQVLGAKRLRTVIEVYK